MVVLPSSLRIVALSLALCLPDLATASPTPANPLASVVSKVGSTVSSAVSAVSSVAAAASAVAVNGYAPKPAVCPTTPLVRPASGLSTGESTFVSNRQAKANAGLAAWLTKTNSGFSTSKLPVLALTSSGGGLRALLNGAGVIQGFDARDSNVGVSGVFQGLTYQGGLSGGAWLLSSFAGNNYPTITSLKTGLWETAFQDSVLDPANVFAGVAYSEVSADIAAKQAAGHPITVVDPYGRLLSYQLLYGTDGGVADTLSGITSLSNFTSHNVPYPIITSRGVNELEGECSIPDNATQYEFHPYEFGSWDAGVHAFTQTAYLGSALTGGSPTVAGACTKNYDNLGYVLGTSSNVFVAACDVIPPSNSSTDLGEALEAIVAKDHTPVVQDIYAIYRNPFYNYSGSPLVSSQTQLDLVDGGVATVNGQNDPIWPFIQPARNVSALIVSDNSADTTTNFPNGTEIHETYIQAKLQGLTKMPVIPPVSTFISKGLNTRATFFGCNDSSVITIIYLPNVAYSYASNTSTLQLEYPKAETDGIIGNGVNIANQNGTAGWPTCLGCAIQMKTGTTLPAACTACFQKYCYTT